MTGRETPGDHRAKINHGGSLLRPKTQQLRQLSTSSVRSNKETTLCKFGIDLAGSQICEKSVIESVDAVLAHLKALESRVDDKFARVHEDLKILRQDTQAGSQDIQHTLKSLKQDVQEPQR